MRLNRFTYARHGVGRTASSWTSRVPTAAGLAVAGLLVTLVAACTVSNGRNAAHTGSGSNVANATTTTVAPTTSTTACPLNSGSGTAQTVPVGQVCSSAGAPHFATPQAAMVYLASAWNTHDVQEIDYVTDPHGRIQMDSMAAQMVDLQFKSCTQNPAGDYTCYFSHDIVPSTSRTTYPNPGGYPPGEAVFTVAPAEAPGWYLTEVVHCG